MEAKSSSHHRIDATEMNVFCGQPLVNRRALLEEQHPRSYRCADVRQHDDQSVLGQPSRERLPGNECAADKVPIRVRKQRHRNKTRLKMAIASRVRSTSRLVDHDSQAQEHECTANRGPWGKTKKTQACPNGNKLSDQRQEIADAQVD